MATPASQVRATQWLTVATASARLDMRPGALRRALERRARRGVEGATEANFDGIYAKKLGRIWRVRFSDDWEKSGVALAGS